MFFLSFFVRFIILCFKKPIAAAGVILMGASCIGLMLVISQGDASCFWQNVRLSYVMSHLFLGFTVLVISIILSSLEKGPGRKHGDERLDITGPLAIWDQKIVLTKSAIICLTVFVAVGGASGVLCLVRVVHLFVG